MRATVVQGRRAAGMQRVEAKVKDAALPASYEAIFLMKPGVEDSVRSAEVETLKALFIDGGATEFEVGPCTTPLFGCTTSALRRMSWVGPQ